MCMSVKTPKPPEPPASPPPPTAVAETVKTPEQAEPMQKKRRGAQALVLRRPTMGGLGSRATGVNISNYYPQ